MGSVLAPVAAAAPLYHVTVLGELPFPNDSVSGARGINDAGQVVGFSDSRAFLWTNSDGMQDLGTLQPEINDHSWANAINNAGQVVGKSNFSNTQAFLWTSTGGMQYLGDLPDGTPTQEAHDINEAGQVVGATNAAGGSAFLWTESGGAEDLGELPGSGLYGTQAWGINDAGEVVGVSKGRPFLWTRSSGMQDLGVSLFPYDINNVGQVVGEGGYEGVSRASLWTSTGGMQDLGDLPGQQNYSYATDINDAGQIIGITFDETGAFYTGAFLWTSTGGMQGITTLLDSSGDGWFIEEVYGINNAGQIAAYGRSSPSDRYHHALLLTPIPEPSTLAMVSCGLAIVAVVGLRRGRQRRDKSTGDGNGI
jgi:probable HAF family extracellular repeat protein